MANLPDITYEQLNLYIAPNPVHNQAKMILIGIFGMEKGVKSPNLMLFLLHLSYYLAPLLSGTCPFPGLKWSDEKVIFDTKSHVG
jgi:hypothetical protein